MMNDEDQPKDSTVSQQPKSNLAAKPAIPQNELEGQPMIRPPFVKDQPVKTLIEGRQPKWNRTQVQILLQDLCL